MRARLFKGTSRIDTPLRIDAVIWKKIMLCWLAAPGQKCDMAALACRSESRVSLVSAFSVNSQTYAHLVAVWAWPINWFDRFA
jgi:hypothetical protein